jgi:hypothetical protein
MTFALSRDVTVAESENGLVLLDERDGRHWRLNGTAAATLRLLLDGYSPAAAATRLARDFPGASTRASADVHAFVDALRKAGLVGSETTR